MLTPVLIPSVTFADGEQDPHADVQVLQIQTLPSHYKIDSSTTELSYYVALSFYGLSF